MIHISLSRLALLVTSINAVFSSPTLSGPLAAVNGPTELLSVKDDNNGGSSFELTDSAKAIFQQLTGPVYVVGMLGNVQEGKSTNLSFFVREW